MTSTVSKESERERIGLSLLLETSTSSGVRILTLNRPKARNALNRTLSNLLCSALVRAESDSNIRVVVLSATAPVFCAGVDINELRKLTPFPAYEQQWLTDWPRQMREMRKPVVAAVDGIALGGGFELVLLADVVFASKKAQFGLPEISLGTIPGAGGTIRLVERVGKGRALSMMWTAERMGVEEAFTRGIVTKICEDAVQESIVFAEAVADQSVHCVRMTKEMVKTRESEWNNRATMERMMYYLSFGSMDFIDGCDHFVQGRERRERNKDDERPPEPHGVDCE
ncbi:unnamed protein product [Agarophyton chilense]|eukprot:gb/GEZJ01006869.1/.p1 GENE.gb/GEZJ01006869.1/~~gb/GEZJ01006869.1/.p1  ORF type:complete len:284 (-),score=33.78 gb/GEZJ01006869.1/:157-1008(-)